MKLITFTLVPLVVLSLLSVVLGNEFTSMPYDYGDPSDDCLPDYLCPFGPGKCGGCSDEGGGEIGIDPLTGAISIIVVIATATALLGIQFLGSGLSDNSVRVLITVAIYASIWTILSLLAIPLIKGIEFFGTLIYVGLTIGYIIGVMEKISGVGD